jgi:hypothetical protein
MSELCLDLCLTACCGAPAGKCAAFLKSSSCKDVDPGEAAVAQCISELVAAAEAGDSQDAGAWPGQQCALRHSIGWLS